MITLKNINKYFFKNKSNENHVCKSINLQFGDDGFVVLLGHSGSGKTTLLNIMSGMDNFDSGFLSFDDEEFVKFSSKKWDKIRNNKIGYIYQNYNLINTLTVYENIELVIKMNGISDEDDIQSRITYLLETVGMLNYEDRLTKQLSGGQQQRVAFARALARDPKVIIADEPTGNLDSKTTLELMAVLKNISKERLVVMVTHEQALANYYADRIIEIENGSIIKDYKNVKSGKLSIIQEHLIYLEDYSKSEINKDAVNLNRYQDQGKDVKDPLSIDIVEKNDTVYVRIDSENAKRIKIIDNNSEFELLYESSDNLQPPLASGFKLNELKGKNKNVKHSVITFKDSFKYAWRKVNVLSYGGKMLYVVLALMGIIISISAGLLGETYREIELYSDQNRNYISVTTENIPYEEINELLDVIGVEQIMLVNEKFDFDVISDTYYEITGSFEVEALPVDIAFFDESLLIAGTVPVGYGVIIDKTLADGIIKKQNIRGVETYEDVLNCSFKLQTSSVDDDHDKESYIAFPISGIASDNSPSVWMDEDLIYSFVTPELVAYTIFEDNFVLLDGEIPTTFRDVMIHKNSKFLEMDDVPYSIGITTGEYQISGTFDYLVDNQSYNYKKSILTTTDFIKHEYFVSEFISKRSFDFLVYSSDIDNSILAINNLGYEASSIYLFQEGLNDQIRLSENANIYLLSIGGIIISGVSIYFIMRSSLISRVYEVSVYRSLGAPKKEIVKMFFVEILLTTTFSTLIGFIAMTLLLTQAESSVGPEFNIVHYSLFTLLFSIIGLYIINIIFGLLPIVNLLRKTPSNIMKHYDL